MVLRKDRLASRWWLRWWERAEEGAGNRFRGRGGLAWEFSFGFILHLPMADEEGYGPTKGAAPKSPFCVPLEAFPFWPLLPTHLE